MVKVNFDIHPDLYDSVPHPRPANKFVPEWYKEMGLSNQCPVQVNENGDTVLENDPTLKQCLPVRDYLTSGYIIPLWYDLVIKRDTAGKYHDLSRTNKETGGAIGLGCDWHAVRQVVGSPLEKFSDGDKLLKILNPWNIRTPKGYSSFIFSPFYHESSVTILPAIVDTDRHDVQINLPAVITEDEVNLKQGAPLVQVIPFKRESWTHKVTKTDVDKHRKASFRFQLFTDSVYTKEYWKKKLYR